MSCTVEHAVTPQELQLLHVQLHVLVAGCNAEIHLMPEEGVYAMVELNLSYTVAMDP